MPTAYYPVDGTYKAWTPDMVGAAAASHTHNYAGSTSPGGSATTVKLDVGTADAYRAVWFSDSSNINAGCYSNNFKYNPVSNIATINATGISQTAVISSDYSNWRSLIWGSANSTTEGFTPTSVNGSLYTANTLSVQPSTGTIKATTFKGNLTGNATTASSAATATKTSGIADYNNANNTIQIGYAGNSFTASDFSYALGMSQDKKIKDVSKAEYQKWLGLGSAAYTASSAYAAANHSHSQYAPNDIVTVSDTQPTSSTCKIWIKA